MRGKTSFFSSVEKSEGAVVFFALVYCIGNLERLPDGNSELVDDVEFVINKKMVQKTEMTK